MLDSPGPRSSRVGARCLNVEGVRRIESEIKIDIILLLILLTILLGSMTSARNSV